MRNTLKKAAVGLTVGAGLMAGLFSPASAAPGPDANKGHDSKFDLVYIGGSDTTYDIENRIAALYNASPGCDTNNATGAVTGSLNYNIAEPVAGNKSTCNTVTQDNRHNYDHDIISNIFPTGSSAGVTSAQGGQWHAARSSRELTAGELTTLTGLGIAKDAIVINTYGTKVPAAAGFTKTQLANIYTCQGTRSDANGTGLYSYNDLFGDGDNTLIHPYGVQTSSGTYGSFKTWVGVEPSPAAAPGTNCVEPVDNTAPVTGLKYAFENDAKPVLADADLKGIDRDGVLWWGSNGPLSTYQFKRQGGNFWPIVKGVTPVSPTSLSIADNSYDITRIIYRGVLDSTMAPGPGNAANVALITTGATSDQAGATRSFSEWTCQPASYLNAAGRNPNNNLSYFAEITASIEAEGFQRVPTVTGERNFGACRVQT